MSAEAERLCNEGLELMTQHRWEEAEGKMNLAVREDKQSPELWYNLGKCRFHQDKYIGAELALRLAVELKFDYAEAHALLGSSYYAMHAVWEAINSFSEAACHKRSDENFNRECLTARAHCYLAKGDYVSGFEDYEHRLKERNTWNGTQSLVGKTLLVKAEGGLGDQIFFYRYDELLGALGAGYVIWEVDAPLKDYFGSVVTVEVKNYLLTTTWFTLDLCRISLVLRWGPSLCSVTHRLT